MHKKLIIYIMSNFKKTKVRKVTSVFLSATTVIWLSGAAALVPMVAQADTMSDLQAQIASLLAQITTLQAQLATLSGGTTGAVCGYTFAKDLSSGDTGADVKNLQTVLNSDVATQVAASGVGSSGSETEYFGSMTKAAVVKFQDKYASEVLTPIGLSAGTGYLGSMSRAKLNALYGTCGTTPVDPVDPDEPVVVSPGTGLTVTASAVQPVSSLMPLLSTRVPYTNVDFTAGSDGDVTITSLVVERTGLAVDAVFSGVLLLDETGMQLGLAKTLNSVHQVTLTEDFVVKAGQTRTMTIAGNAATAAGVRAGQVAYLSLVTVNTTATVSGALPITGSNQTVSETLTIGTVTIARGPLDPGASATAKEIGTTGYTFSSVKVTAGSQEKVRVHSIRWNQSGSATVDDVANVKTYIDGVAYDTVISSSGKYYTASFNGGILIDKGFSKEISIKGDLVGGAARTIDFDVYKRTDIYLVGETYRYGINPPDGTDTAGTDDGAFHLSTNPWYDAFQVTVSSGTINTVKASTVEAANVAVNLADQVLGGFEMDVKGEEISVSQTIFHFLITNTSGQVADITNISLYDANGNVVAGPADGSGAAIYGTVTFSDTITYPVGKGIYTLKGKLGTDFANNQTVTASTTPGSDWTTITGLTTGNSITPTPSSAVTGNAMTVKAAALTVSVSAAPVAQNVVAGISGYTFANYIFDGTQSGEDVKLTNIPLSYNTLNTATDLTNCALWDGSTALNTSGNIINPSTAGSSTTFTFDDAGFTVPKGTSKSVALKCDISGNAGSGSIYQWGISGAVHQLAATTYTAATGLTSGQTVVEVFTTSAGQQMTIASGSLAVSLDASSPSYTMAAGGTLATLSVLRFEATNEDIKLSRVALQFTNGASNTPIDVSGAVVTLWDGVTQIGEAVFATNDYATSTITGTVVIPKDGYKRITVKGDISLIGTGKPGTQGHLIMVDWDGNGDTGTQGIGQSAGSTVTASGSDTAVSGVRTFRSVPTFAKLSIPDTIMYSGDRVLYRFSVTADTAGDVGIGKFTARLATSSATAGTKVDDINMYAYADSGFGTVVSGLGTSGELLATAIDADIYWASAATDLNFWAETGAGASTTIQIPAGATRWFEVRGTVTTAGSAYSVSTQIQGDSAYQSLATTFMNTGLNAEVDANDDFIWSPNATTTSLTTHVDWTNGYGVSGLSGSNMTASVLSK